MPGPVAAPARGRRRRTAAIALLALLAAAITVTWTLRKDIADNFIASKFESLGIPARYEIVAIGPTEQVIRNLVVGDPRRPDLTVAEVRVATRIAWGLPGIGRITAVRPRLYGSYRGGKPSFGSLDKALFSGGKEPFAMPDLDVRVVDGRALVESDHGRIAARVEGEGPLRGGFAGTLAVLSPALSGGGCTAGRTTLYGKLTTSGERPRFVGPMRMAGLSCPEIPLRLAHAGVQIDVTIDKALDGAEGSAGLAAGPAAYAQNRLGGASAKARFAWRNRALTASYTLAGRDIVTPQARAASLSFDGRIRSTQGLARFDVEGDLAGKGIALGATFDRALRDAADMGNGTLIAPVALQMRTAFARETRGSTIDGNVIVRRSGDGFSLVVPRGSLRGGSGASLVAISRLQALLGEGPPRITGNFATGGEGLPQVSGRMETGLDGGLAMQVAMPEYRAGTSRIALPQLALVQGRNGALGFLGEVRMSGDLPGGRAENLLLPVEGNWAANGDLSVWPRCTPIAFDSLRLTNLTLDRRRLTACPPRGGAIVERRGGRLLMAAGMPSLDVTGRLGETPIRIASGPIGIAMPGVIKARALRVALGPAQTASHFVVSDLSAHVGKDVAGTFDKADIALYAVPLDLHETAGNWRYADGVLGIDGARFILVDRQPVARFQPMVARDATLRLENNVITAQALLREPTSDREVARAAIVHDLATAGGHADLAVEGITFDDRLQADMISRLALGVVSSLKGQVHGTGRIDWNAAGITSHGRFASDGLAFAAAFGPVQGLSGEVIFTDLLGMVTAPAQSLKIAAINPGIEVTDGTLSFEMRPGYLLVVNGAHWPFMDGQLTLEPARMQIGIAETRRYTLKVTGLNAATFVQHLELSNINASGTFDGEMPLVFDENGGRIENGYLVSRPPGGNVSYIGALTYKDLSAMGNFAFDALRSANYKRMEIGLGGSLSGEILTRISFDGLSQGAGAKQNFVTKQIAKLPIRFIVNIKAPFFSLFGSMRSLYDPEYVTDPRVLGLMDTQGHKRDDTAQEPGQDPQVSPIQPPVSEKIP